MTVGKGGRISATELASEYTQLLQLKSTAFPRTWWRGPSLTGGQWAPASLQVCSVLVYNLSVHTMVP